MLERSTCVQGHAWESSTEDESARCPECGSPPDPGLFEESAASPSPVPVPLSDDRGKPIIVGYEILADLGRSPQGVRLYRAKQLIAGREVLLQVVLAREDSGQRAWNALRGEAGGHGKLSHPHIVQLYETGERDRQLFFNAMEFVDGPTLADVVGDDPLPVAQALALVELLARAVAYANDQRQLHRHLEPSAVILQRIPAPKAGPAKEEPGGGACRLREEFYIPRIRGFGLARRPLEGGLIDIDLFADAGYLSPEQSWGKGQELGPHTDVYGLGGILYYLLTGRPPFRGPTQDDVIDAIQTAPLVKPSDIRRTPAAVQFVCQSALARRVSRRYPDAGEMADDLRRIARHLPPPGSKLSRLQRFDLLCRRRPATMMGICLLIWMVLGTVGTYLAISDRGRADETDSTRNHHETFLLYNEAQRLRDQLREVTAWQQIHGHQGKINFAAVVAGVDKEAARGALDECPVSERRHFEWLYLDRLLRAEEKTTIPDSQNATAFAVNRSGPKVIAVAKTNPGGDKSTIRVYDVASSDEWYNITIHEAPVRRMSYLGDQILVVLAGTKPGRLHLLEGRTVMAIDDTVASPTAIGIGGQNELLVLNDRGELRIHDANDLRPRGPVRSLSTHDVANPVPARVVVLPHGLGIALSGPTGEDVFVSKSWQPDGGDEDDIPIEGKVECMTSTIKGTLAIATSEKYVYFHQLPDEGNSPPPYRGLKGEAKHMAFSPEGNRLAVAYADDTLGLLGYVPPRPVALRIDGRAEPGHWVELLTIPVSGVGGVEFGSDGKTLVAASPKGVVVLGAWK